MTNECPSFVYYRDVQPPSDHDDDLMTPPNVLLEAALQRAESLNEQKSVKAHHPTQLYFTI